MQKKKNPTDIIHEQNSLHKCKVTKFNKIFRFRFYLDFLLLNIRSDSMRNLLILTLNEAKFIKLYFFG